MQSKIRDQRSDQIRLGLQEELRQMRDAEGLGDDVRFGTWATETTVFTDKVGPQDKIR